MVQFGNRNENLEKVKDYLFVRKFCKHFTLNFVLSNFILTSHTVVYF